MEEFLVDQHSLPQRGVGWSVTRQEDARAQKEASQKRA